MWSMKQGARRPSRYFRLKQNGQVMDLSEASSVLFVFSTGTLRKEGAAIVVDAAAGRVRYDWAAGDTDTAGEYACEFVVTVDGLEEVVPGGGVSNFKISPRL